MGHSDWQGLFLRAKTPYQRRVYESVGVGGMNAIHIQPTLWAGRACSGAPNNGVQRYRIDIE